MRKKFLSLAAMFFIILGLITNGIAADEQMPCGIIAVVFHPRARLGGEWWWGFDRETVRAGIERAFNERGLGRGVLWPAGVPNTVQELYAKYGDAIHSGQIRCIAEVYSAEVRNREQLGSATFHYGSFSISGTLQRVSVTLGFRFARIFSAESLPVVEFYPEASGSAFGLIAASGYMGAWGSAGYTTYNSQRDLDTEAFKNAAREIIKLLPLPQNPSKQSPTPPPTSSERES